MKSFTPSLPPCSSCRKFHEPQCGRPHCFVWLLKATSADLLPGEGSYWLRSERATDWITTTYYSLLLCVPWKPLASVWVWPNPLRRRENNFTAPHGVTPSQSYLFPSDLTQQVDHISFGGLAEDSWVGDMEPEWIKYSCQEKKLQCSLRREDAWNAQARGGVLSGETENRKEDEVTMCEIQRNQQWFEKAGQIGTCPGPFWEQALSLHKFRKSTSLFLFLPLIRFFTVIVMLHSLHFPPYRPHQKNQDLWRHLPKTNRPLC